MSAVGGAASRGGYTWREEDSFAELTRLGGEWQVTYGFEATATRGRIVVSQRTTPDYEDAVRQVWQVIGYYFAEPEHAERVRRELLERAGLDPGASKYLPLPDNKFVTKAGGGAGAADEARAEVERRARILRGDPEPAPAAPPAAGKPARLPWWKRTDRRSKVEGPRSDTG